MSLLYDDLSALMDGLDRVLPQQHKREGHSTQFCPSLDMLVENTRVSVQRVSTTSNSWRMDESHVPTKHTKHSGRRWYAVNKTRVPCTDRELSLENGKPVEAGKPDGMRVWHASDAVKRLLLLARHDMDCLFSPPPDTQVLPTDGGEDSTTLLITPTHTLGYAEGVSLLKESNPYVVRLCNEYAKMVCWLYNLSQEEFAMLTQMSISRHVAGKVASLQRTGGGYHDSGPILIVGLGTPRVQHDLVPSLMKSEWLTPVRVTVTEGDMVALDGCSRSNYGHGYTHLTASTTSPLYTINFFMDCMRRTVCIGYDPITRGVLMETPVEGAHSISATMSARQQGQRGGGYESPTLGIVRAMRSRIQNAESILISSKYIARASARKEPPDLQERTCPPPS